MATAQLQLLLQHFRKLAAKGCSSQPTDRQLLDDFSSRCDQTAFAALLARHGPMVLRVCRRVLNHEQDAEDAFQATFLVLARNSGSIRKREAMAKWLHGVAYRTAMAAKRKAARQRKHEARRRALSPEAVPSPTWDDVQVILDEEIQRLPDVFRTVFVLCILEGKTGPVVAAELGITEGTVSSRLTRARQRLQRQLARRGIQLSLMLAALAVAESTSQAAVPTVLAGATLRSALLAAISGTAVPGIPVHVATLAAEVTHALFLTKVKIGIAILLTLSLLATGSGMIAHEAMAGKRPGPPAAARPFSEQNSRQFAQLQPTEAKPPPAKNGDSIVYRGHVLGPDGRPIGGAKLYLTTWMGYLKWPSPSPQYATTKPDGHFEFTVPRAQFADYSTVVAATAANYGAGWVKLSPGGTRDDLTIRLVADDMPITGQIVDLEAKPVPKATLAVMQINAAPGEDLEPWLNAAKEQRGASFQLEQQYLSRITSALCPTVTTDADGRFQLSGIGRNRLVTARLDGPTIATQDLHILTRPGNSIEVMYDKGNPEFGIPRVVTTYYGASFRHVAAPTKPIIGMVRDKDTKKPLAGVTIQSYGVAIKRGFIRGMQTVRTKSDGEGHYRLTGMPKGDGYLIVALPDQDQPYVAIKNEVPNSPGLAPVTVDFELRRGVWIEGLITNKMTGQPVKASVEYFALYSNPSLADYPGFDGTTVMDYRIVPSKEDGSYRVVGLPGPGVVGVYYSDSYLRAPQRDDEYGAKEPSLSTSPYHLQFPSNYRALARISPAKGADAVKRDITLDPGWRFTGMVLGLDGKPLAGARLFGLNGRHYWEPEPMKTAEFTANFNPHQPNDILFQHPQKKLIGVAQQPKANGDSITVQMKPGATVTGRLVGEDGQPRTGVELKVTFRAKGWGSWFAYAPEAIKSDDNGSFRVDTVLPGYEFRLSDDKGEVTFGDRLRSGQMLDLGNIRIRSQP